MGLFVKHEPCPKCGSRDNLARYNDGSATCFGCGYYERGYGRPPDPKAPPVQEEVPNLPDDVCCDYTTEMLYWCNKYGLSAPELLSRGVVCSPRSRRLIFTFVAENQQTVIWQSRNFYEQARSKANTYGNIYDYLVLYRHSGNLGGIALGVGTESVRLGRRLVIVEDPVSAIKIARQGDCMPLLGSSVQPHKINAVAGLYSRLIVWLDEDKLAESMRIAQLAQMLGMEVKVVHTKLDPKEYDDSEIETHLQ